MSNNDLIRRGDALNAMNSVALTYGATWEPHSVKLCKEALRALPAVQPTASPDVMALVEAAEKALHDVDDLVANSEGVAGLHLNGTVADWESLLEGGEFCAWLQSLEALRAAIARVKGGA